MRENNYVYLACLQCDLEQLVELIERISFCFVLFRFNTLYCHVNTKVTQKNYCPCCLQLVTREKGLKCFEFFVP